MSKLSSTVRKEIDNSAAVCVCVPVPVPGIIVSSAFVTYTYAPAPLKSDCLSKSIKCYYYVLVGEWRRGSAVGIPTISNVCVNIRYYYVLVGEWGGGQRWEFRQFPMFV